MWVIVTVVCLLSGASFHNIDTRLIKLESQYEDLLRNQECLGSTTGDILHGYDVKMDAMNDQLHDGLNCLVAGSRVMFDMQVDIEKLKAGKHKCK